MDSSGRNSRAKFGGTAKDCLDFGERPSTPPEIRKYRKSATLAPGVRYIHYGMASDYASKNLGELTFGEQSERGNNTAADLLNHHRVGELERINKEKAERIYHTNIREPLGRSIDRHMVLPTKFTEGKQPFGVSSKSSAEPAKDIIFPDLNEDDLKAEAIYIRTHGSWGPGQQTKRGYDWGERDPSQRVFGMKGNSIALNGVSKDISDVLKGGDNEPPPGIIKKVVEDFRGAHDLLGKGRKLNPYDAPRPYDTVYGRSSLRKGGKAPHTAADVMKGRYKEEDLQPDPDLGKSITPGFRNVTHEDRAFGCPSIRSDLAAAPRNRRSVADGQNYGDDVPASELINPKAFTSLNMAPGAMEQPRPRERVLKIFASIGYSLAPEVGDAVFAEAAEMEFGPHADMCSIRGFQPALNEYLRAVDNGHEMQWRQERGL